MNTLRNICIVTSIAFVTVLSACGGGGGGDSINSPTVTTTPASTSTSSVPIDYLNKYQGTWIEQCPSQIAFGSPVVYGPASSRRTLVMSAPDVAGKVTIDFIEEFFDSAVACGDYAKKPIVTLKESISSSGMFNRLLTLDYFGPKVFDILNINQPESNILAEGSGASKIMVNGVSKWQITFADGNTYEENEITPKVNGEVGLLIESVNATNNGILRIFQDPRTYVKQ
jgi:hypothetical protein